MNTRKVKPTTGLSLATQATIRNAAVFTGRYCPTCQEATQ